MMRLLALLTAIAALALGAPAVAQAPPPATVTPGVITIGLDMPSDGFQVGAVKGSEVVLARGLEIDLARAVARSLGLQPRFVQVDEFADIVTAGPKPWDMALAQVSITAGRRRTVDFSSPYMRADQGVLLRRGLGSTPRTLRALRPLQLCVQRGTTAVAVVARRVRPATPARRYATVTALVQGLETGRCDAVVYDAPTLAVLRTEVPLRVGPLAGVIPTGERYGIVTPEGSGLTPQINRALAALSADGTVSRLATRWLAVDLSQLRALR